MDPFTFSYAIKPNATNQRWGTLDPDTYSRFGYQRHNGIDIAIAPDKLVRAPFDGTVIRIDNQPKGGGIFFGILSDDVFSFPAFSCQTPKLAKNGVLDGKVIQFPAAECQVLVDYLHLESISAKEGMRYKKGDILAVQDNTGFSTGPHTHCQYRRERFMPSGQASGANAYRRQDGQILTDVDSNTANNSFDPTQFADGMYAADVAIAPAVIAVATQAVAIAQQPIPPAVQPYFVQLLIALGNLLGRLLERS